MEKENIDMARRLCYEVIMEKENSTYLQEARSQLESGLNIVISRMQQRSIDPSSEEGQEIIRSYALGYVMRKRDEINDKLSRNWRGFRIK